MDMEESFVELIALGENIMFAVDRSDKNDKKYFGKKPTMYYGKNKRKAFVKRAVVDPYSVGAYQSYRASKESKNPIERREGKERLDSGKLGAKIGGAIGSVGGAGLGIYGASRMKGNIKHKIAAGAGGALVGGLLGGAQGHWAGFSSRALKQKKKRTGSYI